MRDYNKRIGNLADSTSWKAKGPDTRGLDPSFPQLCPLLDRSQQSERKTTSEGKRYSGGSKSPTGIWFLMRAEE